MRIIILGILLILSAGACTPSHLPRMPTPSIPTRNDSNPTESRSDSWSPQISAGTWHYLIRDSSVISMNNDTSTRVEPVELMTVYTITIRDSNELVTANGHIDSLLLNSHLSTKPTAGTSQTAEGHEVLSRQGHTTQMNISPTVCTGGSASSVQRISELVIPLPTHPIRVGDKWSDTLSTTICRGKIPMAEISERDYELMDLSSCPRGGVRVRQTMVATLSGSSVDSTNHLNASGSGTSNSILCLDQNTGLLVESTGESELQLNVTTTRGMFPFTQKTSTQIERR